MKFTKEITDGTRIYQKAGRISKGTAYFFPLYNPLRWIHGFVTKEWSHGKAYVLKGMDGNFYVREKALLYTLKSNTMNNQKEIEDIEKQIQELADQKERLLGKEPMPKNYELYVQKTHPIMWATCELSPKLKDSFITLYYLICIRDEWRRILAAENSEYKKHKFTYYVKESGVTEDEKIIGFFSFKNEDAAKLFHKCFRPQLQLITDLL